MNDRDWLTAAIAHSRSCTPTPTAYCVGAIVVAADGTELARGYSRETGPTLHAEEVALRRIAPETGGVSEMWDVRSGCAGVPAGPNRVAPAPGGKISGPSVLAVTSKFNAYAAPEQVRYVASGLTQNRVLEYTESSSIGFFVPGVASQTVGFLTTP